MLASTSLASLDPAHRKLRLPTDIVVQTLLSTLLLLVCIVFAAPPLRPIRWNEWAGRMEREGWDPALDGTAAGASMTAPLPGKRQVGGNPYRGLEERRGFWDVRAARAQFATFIREGGGAGVGKLGL